jgi:hypothetical protein
MNASILTLPQADWPYSQSLMRLALGLALGLLIGLERERRGKEAGCAPSASSACWAPSAARWAWPTGWRRWR